MNELLSRAIRGKTITDNVIEDTLEGICEDVHATCNNACPIYEKYGKAPGNDKPFKVNRGCDCFKNGKKMLTMIRSK